ncbi:MAG: hypothetical protein RIM83_05715, partial [Allomuricauda sp.]
MPEQKERIDGFLFFLEKANKIGVTFFLEEGKLKLKTTNVDAIPKDFLKEINDYRDELKNLLTSVSHNHKNIDWGEIHARRIGMTKVPTSYSQERLWFIDRFEGSRHYHIPWVLRLGGTLDIAALEGSLRGLVDRH